MPSRVAHHDTSPRGKPNSPPRDTNVFRPGLRKEDICVGCIVWLPAKNAEQEEVRCIREGCCGQEELRDAAYGHPVLILSVKQRENSTKLGDLICSVAIMTTFKSSPIEKYLQRRLTHSHYRSSFPFQNPDGVSLDSLGFPPPLPTELCLEDNQNMQKQSYVQTEHIYDVPRKLLRCYKLNNSGCRAYKVRLTKQSYEFLARELSLPPEIFHETNTIWETSKARLAILAGKSTTSITPQQNPTVPTTPPHYPTSSRPLTNPQTYPPAVPNRLQWATYSAPPPTYTPPTYTQLQRYEARNYGTLPISNPNYSAWQQQQQQLEARIAARARLLEPSGESEDEEGCKGLFVTCVVGFVVVLGWVWWRGSK